MGRFHFTPAYRRVGHQNNIAKGVSTAVMKVPGKPQPVLFYRFFSPLFCEILKAVIKQQQFGADKIKVFDSLLIMTVFIHKKAQ
jgi:hypothetical protein